MNETIQADSAHRAFIRALENVFSEKSNMGGRVGLHTQALLDIVHSGELSDMDGVVEQDTFKWSQQMDGFVDRPEKNVFHFKEQSWGEGPPTEGGYLRRASVELSDNTISMMLTTGAVRAMPHVNAVKYKFKSDEELFNETKQLMSRGNTALKAMQSAHLAPGLVRSFMASWHPHLIETGRRYDLNTTKGQTLGLRGKSYGDAPVVTLSCRKEKETDQTPVLELKNLSKGEMGNIKMTSEVSVIHGIIHRQIGSRKECFSSLDCYLRHHIEVLN